MKNYKFKFTFNDGDGTMIAAVRNVNSVADAWQLMAFDNFNRKLIKKTKAIELVEVVDVVS